MTMPNGIDLILADHAVVNELFDRFSSTGDGSIVGQVLDQLRAHDDAERAALYPLVGLVLGDPDMVNESTDAHQAVRMQMDLVSAQEGVPLVEAFGVLRALVDEHVEKEERDILPALVAQATPDQLEALGTRLLQAKQRGG